MYMYLRIIVQINHTELHLYLIFILRSGLCGHFVFAVLESNLRASQCYISSFLHH